MGDSTSLEEFVYKLIAHGRTSGEAFKVLCIGFGFPKIEKICETYVSLSEEEKKRFKEMPLGREIYVCQRCKDKRVYKDELGGLTLCTHRR